MGGRDKNFEDPMQSDQDIRKTKYGQRRYFRVHPLTLIYFIFDQFFAWAPNLYMLKGDF